MFFIFLFERNTQIYKETIERKFENKKEMSQPIIMKICQVFFEVNFSSSKFYRIETMLKHKLSFVKL
jgi:hypothetical protein